MSALTLRGHPASPGAALGPAWTRNGHVDVEGGTPEEHAAQARRGLELAGRELGALAARLRADGHGADAEIVETNELMAADADLVEAAVAAALGGLTARAAIAAAAEPHAEALAQLEDPMLAARAADLRAIARRAGELAAGVEVEPPARRDHPGRGPRSGRGRGLERPHRRHRAGGRRRHGPRGHRGALAGHPARHGRRRRRCWRFPTGRRSAWTPTAASSCATPTPPRARGSSSACALADAEAERDRAERRQPAVTTDGRALRLLANAGTRAEVDAALEAGAEGIGLLRSEMAFLEASAWPSEEEHRAALAPLLEPLAAPRRDRAHARLRRRQDAAVPDGGRR